jgi:hypothetical protein
MRGQKDVLDRTLALEATRQVRFWEKLNNTREWDITTDPPVDKIYRLDGGPAYGSINDEAILVSRLHHMKQTEFFLLKAAVILGIRILPADLDGMNDLRSMPHCYPRF